MLFLPARAALFAFAAGSILLAWEPRAGLALDATVAVLFILDGLLARRLGPPAMELALKLRLGQGEEARARVELWNRSGTPARLRLVLDLARSLSGEGAEEAREVLLAPDERRTVEWPLLARRRGLHPVGPLHWRHLGPLRLAWRRGRFECGRQAQVIPGLLETGRHRLLALRQNLGQEGLRRVRRRGGGGSFESLREYARGDDPRRIDWKATARRGQHIVREYEAERSQNIILCIDTGRLMAEEIGGELSPRGERAGARVINARAAGGGSSEGAAAVAAVEGTARLDRALAAAVVLAEVARAWNDHVGLFAFSDRVHAILPPGRHPPDLLPAIFSTLESRSVEPDYPRALVRLSRSVSRRSLLVFFGDLIDEAVSAPLAAQLARLARRHLPLFVAIRNPSLFDAAQASVATPAEAIRRAAASELVLARARALARLREGGVLVADVLPDTAIAATVERYLDVKRRGAL